MKRRAFLLGPLALSACGFRQGTPQPGTLADTEALTRGLVAMGGVDISEARRAATLAYAETFRLAQAYRITDAPLIHNAKVNAGRKPRGLCWHWAEDLERALNARGFGTLQTHRAIANADSTVRIDHSTAILAPRGAQWHEGMVLDPWRRGGVLFWAPVREDTHYNWDEREAVLRRHGRIRYLKQGDGG